MKDLKLNNELLGYAFSFVSFIIPKLEGIKEIILFGSVARKEADKNSDVDLFFNILDANKENILKNFLKIELDKFYKSKFAEVWFNKGIKNPIKIQVGKLEQWKLKRSIISDGIMVYSKYKENPENLKAYAYFNIFPVKEIAKRNKVLRKLFGRREKGYNDRGLVEKYLGKQQSLWSFFVPLENSKDIEKFLNDEKIKHKTIEFWTDQLV
jgi:predicted nucleotidyltransferase